MVILAQLDISEKVLMDHNDVFSDIFNNLVFNGEPRIAEDDLENSSVTSQYKADDARLHQQERDILKYWKNNGVRLALLGLENQTLPEALMPFRVFAYDGACYRSQLMNRPWQVLPVVTIVLYFGTEHPWNKPTHLKDLLTIPAGLDPFVNDYEIHVFNIAWLEEEQIQRFKSDFRLVAEFFRDKRLGRLDIQKDTTRLKHVDEILKLLTVLTKDDAYVQLLESGKEIHSMCDFAQSLIAEGRQEGIQQGMQQGIQQGMQQGIQQGMQEGIQQGMQQGMQQGRMASAASMLMDGMDPNKVAKYSGLPLAQVLQMARA